ncbi:ATP-dependent zinc metalloprotease FTSH 2, chloroplastic [Capsicum baccatum]|uniref:ATP-dependent zinc metalloprotease FTSH 2, chloroplastic n=1 Tax=Capsicum baccatum TaxID=33114 RepID=A0A2G2X2V1_CAPBA|nr:ATP-dependent zinc metalloprotease FTSH 2, chloroplastic [Capsicum baccatum]
MDGFTKNTGVIVIYATNSPEILSQDLLRPGSFDRKVSIGVPNIKGRKDILKVYSNNKKLDKDISLSVIAMRTPGFYGSDLVGYYVEMVDNEKNGLHQQNDGIFGKLKSVEVEMYDVLREKDEIEKMLNGKKSEIDLLRKKLGDIGDEIVNERIV